MVMSTSLENKYHSVIDWFRKNMPSVRSELNYSNAYQLLTAVILSAQCTDKRVNMVTPALFEKYPDPVSLASASEKEIFTLIKSVSFPNNKASHLSGMARMLVSDFNSEVPSSVEELQKLPGVGRKTANVVASIIFGAPVIAVDTHVFRVSRRLGLSDGDTVEKVEKDLTDNIPEEYRAVSHHWLILHGRYVCTARKPKCDKCGISEFCDYRKES